MLRQLSLATLVLATVISMAAAHVTMNPNTNAANSYFASAFRVPHGCNGSPTTLVSLKIPESLTGVKPRIMAGWNITIGTKPLDPPITAEGGKTINTTADTITWTNGLIPDNMYEDFWLSFRLPPYDDPKTINNTVYFPVSQQCQDGTWLNWTQIPGSGASSSQNPAPYIKLTNGNTPAQASEKKSDASKLNAFAGVALMAAVSSLMML
ncbi:uncharacterized protein VTP21DRAFT_4130 [Calcarisporiella thermophila]|uniref:uncharacterized protein n=1 Tax=Calcarisporiella thermophila TaxID=911321 RepID=UPI0037424F44